MFHDIGDIRLDKAPEPNIREAADAIGRPTASAICGTDLIVRGPFPGTDPGHAGVGMDEQVGRIGCNFPTGRLGTDPTDGQQGHSIAVFGCGPTGQFAIANARLMGVGRIIAIGRRDNRMSDASLRRSSRPAREIRSRRSLCYRRHPRVAPSMRLTLMRVIHSRCDDRCWSEARLVAGQARLPDRQVSLDV